jgi:NDP-sugar pyrophosphorylase family protein
MEPTLLILAAGMASRYGSMKQIQSFGPGGETIMDYSIYDAIRAGFKKVVFIIREEFADNFKAIVEPPLKGKIAIDYVYQNLQSFTDGYQVPADRTKPWGTAHAVLCAKNTINEPFAVINADDFYGRDAFEKAYTFLTKTVNDNTYSIIGYELLKTLSDNGTVNRGVCRANANGDLIAIAERLNIAEKDGKIIADDHQEPKELPRVSQVSMNFWCFSPSIFAYSEKLFNEFLSDNGNLTNIKSEFFIPIVADKFINANMGAIKVIPTSAQWFGVTYKEDAPEVKEKLNELVSAGEYPASLWK